MIGTGGMIGHADHSHLPIRHGGRHDWYQNPKTGAAQPVPRHREVNEILAKHILRMLRAGPTQTSAMLFRTADEHSLVRLSIMPTES